MQSDIIQLISAVLGLVSVLIDCGRKEKQSPILWIGVIFLVVAIAIPAWGFLPPKIEVTNLQDNSPVELYQVVEGTGRRIPETRQLWLIVYSHSAKRYYPQVDHPLPVFVGKEWRGSVTFGLPGDCTDTYDLLVVLADANAHQDFQDYAIDSYRAQEGFPGIDALPDGIKVYQRIKDLYRDDCTS
jgi:hypothetical protein